MSSRGLKRASREDLEGFETTYNVACEHIARGQLNQAQLLLKRAKGAFRILHSSSLLGSSDQTHNVTELCSSSENLSPEDKAAEVVPISVQQLYIALHQGKLDEAASLVQEISVDRYAFVN